MVRTILPGALVIGLLTGCAGAPADPAPPSRWQAGAPGVEDVYRRALAELGPHRYTGVHIPAVVLDTPPGPVIKPARLLPGGRGIAPPPPAQPWQAVPVPPPETRPPPETAEAPVPPRAPIKKPAAVKPAAAPPVDGDEKRGIVSELRFGTLKHAIAFGHSAKETGTDANMEILFHSPAFLSLLLSPRPMIGLTANASATNTDFLYAGLDWQWAPWHWMFLGFSFGLSVHDGMLDNSQITGKARFDRREFGCRALFRESVEVGARFAERHSLSLMWAHHSHGSLCHEENEGIDNAGVRYGVRL